jgi:hypothetical protein
MQWPKSQLINNVDSTTEALTSCVFGNQNQLFVFWKSSSSNQIFFSMLADTYFVPQNGFPAGQLINSVDSTPQTPAACVFNNQLFLFWVENGPANRIWYSASVDGTSWPAGKTINGTDSTPLTPATCVFNNEVFLLWKSNSSNQIFFSSSADGVSWPAGQLINSVDSTPKPPAACVFNHQLFLFWVENGPANRIWYSASPDGASWPSGKTINGTDSTPQALTACVFNGQIFLFWVENGPANRIWYTASPDGVNWPPGQLINGVDATPLAVSATVGFAPANPIAYPVPIELGTGIFLFWKSSGSQSINFNASGQGVFQCYTQVFFEFWTTDDDLRQDSTLTGSFGGSNPYNIPASSGSFPLTGTLTVKPFNAPKFDNWTYNSETVQLSPGLAPFQLQSCMLTLVQGGSGLFEGSDEWHVGGIQISFPNPGSSPRTGYFVFGPLPVGQYETTNWILNQANPTITLNLGLMGTF